MIKYFPALIHKDDDTQYGVSFPDLPGCVSAGDTPEEAIQMAEEALQLHIDGMLEEGEPIPPPSPLSEAVELVRTTEAEVAVLIEARLPGRAKRVNITLDENLLAEIDRAAAERGLTRSAYLAEGARYLMRTARE